MKARANAWGYGLAVLITVGFPTVSQSQTNSWISSSNGAWEDSTNWSLSLSPTNTHSIYVTNDLSKVVTINSVTSGSRPDTMTVTNLFLSAPAGATNILNLSGAGTNTPLTVLDTFQVSAGGSLRMSDSALWMEGPITNAGISAVPNVTNSTFSVDGAVELSTNGLLVADCGIYVGTDTNTSGVVWLAGGRLFLTNTAPSAIGIGGSSQMIVSNGQVQAASGFIFVSSGKGSQGALTIAGGNYVSSAFGRLVIGMETGAVGVVSVSSGNLIITNSFITLVGGDGSGQLSLLGGTNIFGPVQVGGDPGSQGTMTVAGGVNILQHALFVGDSIGATGAVWMTGGQFVQTNSYAPFPNPTKRNFWPTCVGSWGDGVVTVSNGNWLGGSMLLGLHAALSRLDTNLNTGSITFVPARLSHGTLNVNGGTMMLLSNLVVGNCTSGGVGIVNVTGGSLFVTNATHTAFVDVRNGQLNLNGGLLETDKLVMTNTCGLYANGGGTLIVSSIVLGTNTDADGDGMLNGWEQAYGFDPLNPADANADSDGDGLSNLQEFLAGTDPTNSASSFRITSVLLQGTDIVITWSVVTGKTYKVQASSAVFTNAFADLATVVVPLAPAIAETNYLDVGAATNDPPRFYKVKLVIP